MVSLLWEARLSTAQWAREKYPAGDNQRAVSAFLAVRGRPRRRCGPMTALQTLLERYREAAATNREQGTYFEELTVSYFRNEPAYKELYREVVPYSVWAER